MAPAIGEQDRTRHRRRVRPASGAGDASADGGYTAGPFAAAPPMTPTEVLTQALADCAARAREQPVTFGELAGRIGDGSFAFVCLLISLPFLIPISLGPISTAAGAAFLVLGFQMIRGRESPWLPRRLAEAKLGARHIELMQGAAQRVLRVSQRIAQPRWPGWIDGRRGLVLAGWLIVLGGILIAVPLPGLPLTNTIPALSVIFACLALLERDGLMLLIAFGWFVATLAYFALIGYLLYVVGMQAFDWLRDYLPDWLL